VSPDPEPAPPAAGGRARLRARRFFDGLEGRIAASGLGAAAAIAAASVCGVARWTLSRRWPSASEVEALFGIAGPRSRKIARRIAGVEARNRLVIRRLEGRPLDPFDALVSWDAAGGPVAVPRPAILVTAHFGALYLLPSALNRIDAPRLGYRWSALHRPGARERIASTAVGVERRAEMLRDGLATLRSGGLVTTTLDGMHGSSRRGQVLGREIALGEGAFALARLSGAPIVPVAAFWRGHRVLCRAWPPISDAAGAADWLERLLGEEPAQCTLGLLRRLLLDPAGSLAVPDGGGVEAGGDAAPELGVP
jgi:hypothetical protein